MENRKMYVFFLIRTVKTRGLLGPIYVQPTEISMKTTRVKMFKMFRTLAFQVLTQPIT